MTTNQRTDEKRLRGCWWMPWVVLAAGVGVYLNGLAGPFIFDDLRSIQENPRIRELWPAWRAAWAPKDTTVAGRPVATYTLAVNYAIDGLNVRGYHVFNVAAHVAAAVVLFGVVRRTLLGERLRGRYGESASWLALATALVWTVHPLQTESVTYVIQRTELLVGLFYLLTLYCVIRGVESGRAWLWYGGAVAACALGMGSKEVMVTAPLMVLVYDDVFVSRSFREALRRRWGLYAGLAGTWVILGALVATVPVRGIAGFHFADVTPLDYARTQCGVLVHYLRLCFWPWPLVLDYSDWPVARSWSDVDPTAAAVVLVVLGATVWLLYRRPPIGFLGVWFFLILAPTSSIMAIRWEAAAERRMYLPLATVAVLAVIGMHAVFEYVWRLAVWPDRLRQGLGGIVLAATVAALGAITIRRNEDYRSLVSVWSDVVAKRPQNARAHFNLAGSWRAAGNLEKSMAEYEEVLRLDPLYYNAHSNLGILLSERGELEQAIAHYREALRIEPRFAPAHYGLGQTLRRQGRLEEAVMHEREAARLARAWLESKSDSAP